MIEVGKRYDIDSGMGGAFTVRVMKIDGDTVECLILDKGWEHRVTRKLSDLRPTKY